MRKKLKLFVWTDFSPDWTSGLAFAIAKDEEEAKKLVRGEHGIVSDREWGSLEVHELNSPIAFAVTGGS